MRVILIASILLAACGGTQVIFVVGSDDAGTDGGLVPDAATVVDAADDAPDAEEDAGTDAADGGDAGVDPVFGTTTFVPGSPPAPGRANTAAQGTHPASGVSGENCFQSGCHGPGQPGPDWAFGGTIYTSATGSTPVAGAEIRVVGPGGALYARTYSDQDGNFWIDKPIGGDMPASSLVGVRNATNRRLMITPISGNAGSACQAAGCHVAAMRVFLD